MASRKPHKPRTPEERAAARARSNANLRKDGTRKGEGVGRKSKEFIAFCETMLEEANVQGTIEKILTDPRNPNYTGTLRTVAGYAKGTPVQRIAASVGVAHWVAALPAEVKSAEEWLSRHAPAGALPTGEVTAVSPPSDGE